MPYIRITNIDVSNDSAFYYALIPEYNRKVSDVTEWKDPVFIINSFGGKGIYTPDSGDHTFFRRNKSTGQVDFTNCYINCELSSSVVFVVFQVLPEVGYNFKVQIDITETAGNSISSFEYGITQYESDPINTWQTSNIFDLNTESIYYFDVRKIGQVGTVGRQPISLFLTPDGGMFGGGDESDHPTPTPGTSED